MKCYSGIPCGAQERRSFPEQDGERTPEARESQATSDTGTVNYNVKLCFFSPYQGSAAATTGMRYLNTAFVNMKQAYAYY